MNREEKSANIQEIASEIEASEAIFAVDYRGISVPQAAELRGKLREADASFKVVKNRLTKRAADQVGEQRLAELLVGPTALTFVRGDTAQAAKAITTFNKEHDVLTYKGPYYEYENVPIALSPYQKPFPAFWYGSSGEEGSTWAGEEGLHFVTLGPNAAAKANIDTFMKAFAKRGNKPAHPKPEFSGGIAIGVQRHIFVDETDEKAHAWARPAMNKHLEHINWIRVRHGVTATAARMKNTRGANYDECLEEDTVIAGSPKTVLEGIERHVKEIGFNYLLAYLMLGNMTLDTAMRSMKLFVKDVMPAVEKM